MTLDLTKGCSQYLVKILFRLYGKSLSDVGDDVVAPLHSDPQLGVSSPSPDETYNLWVGHQRD